MVRNVFTGMVLLMLAGCGREALTYNNLLAKQEEEVEKAAGLMKAHLTALAEAKDVDAAAAEVDFNALLAALDSAMKETRAAKPGELKLSRPFQVAYLAYYTEYRAAVNGEVRQALELLKDTSITPAEKAAKWKAPWEALGARLKAATEKLRAEQHEFATAHGIRLGN